MKCAVVIPCTTGFIHGLNAILNGLWLYKNNVDVHILWCGDKHPEFFSKLAVTDFGFKVVVVDVHDAFCGQPYHDDVIYKLWSSRWMYGSTLLGYDVVSFFDADSLVLSNIMDVYQAAFTTDMLFTVGHSTSSINFEANWDGAIVNRGDTPYRNHPCFMRVDTYSKSLRDIYQLTYDYSMNDFPCFSYALIRNGIRPFLLPDSLWERNRMDYDQIHIGGMFPEPVLYSETERTRIRFMHGKWFIREHVDKNIVQTPVTSPKYSMISSNYNTLYSTYKWFNEQGLLRIGGML